MIWVSYKQNRNPFTLLLASEHMDPNRGRPERLVACLMAHQYPKSPIVIPLGEDGAVDRVGAM
jgi:hypothetical protein